MLASFHPEVSSAAARYPQSAYEAESAMSLYLPSDTVGARGACIALI